MADGTLDSQVGARICNGLGIMRACLETQKLEQLEARMDEIADRVARDRTNAARERNSTHEAQRLDRKSTRLNSSHSQISYAVFCLKKKKVNAQLVGLLSMSVHGYS